MIDTLTYLSDSDFPGLTRAALTTLQVNLGYRCNQQCLHCHVDASPRRKEVMSTGNIDVVIGFIRRQGIGTLDLTGGAPEMHPEFRRLVCAARELGVHVIDRCNLTITREPGYDWLPGFLYDQQVEVVASLPCYLEENVDRQRGDGVFAGSIDALRELNGLGYGSGDADHSLNLVYNPQGPQLPPEQTQLEADYRRVLLEKWGITFDRLYTIANMPIKRFGSTLISKGLFDEYMALLKSAHLETNTENVMCLSLLSVDWQGYVYDCDFNQMLGLYTGREPVHLGDVMTRDFEGEAIRVMDHCYGCTAGQGSSCGGALG